MEHITIHLLALYQVICEDTDYWIGLWLAVFFTPAFFLVSMGIMPLLDYYVATLGGFLFCGISRLGAIYDDLVDQAKSGMRPF